VEITVKVCDICQAVGMATTRYDITQGDDTVTVDLCPGHEKPILELMGSGKVMALVSELRPATQESTPTPRRARAGRGLQVRTVAEIEASKRGG
jgi:hypothetical protein